MPEIISQAKSASRASFVFDPNDSLFASPGDMPGKIQTFIQERGGIAPVTPGEIARTIFISLALAYKRTLVELEIVTGRSIKTIHILGGGSQIEFLNQLTADATSCEVFAGPSEATLFGNAMLQAIAAGEFKNLIEARSALRTGLIRKSYSPRLGVNWEELEKQLEMRNG